MNNIKKYLYTIAFSVIFVLLIFLGLYEIFGSIKFVGIKLPPFLPTKQLGVDAIGMLFRTESFTKVIPQSYVKEIEGIPVRNDKEFYEVIQKFSDKEFINVKFSNPFFLYENEFEVMTRLYVVGYLDFLISFLLPIAFSILLFALSYYIAIIYIFNYETLSRYKKQMLLGTSVLLLTMGILVVSGIDLVTQKVFLPLLYISFGITGVVLSVFYYYSTYYRLKWWIYVIMANIFISSLFLTGYIVFFDNPKILLSIVKLNYLVIAINVIVGTGYLLFLRRKIQNIIERERIRILTLILFFPILILSLVFFIQGISFYTVPISIFFLMFVVVSPMIASLINDHNVKLSKERIMFSIIIAIIMIVGFSIISGMIVNLSEESMFLFGIYGVPFVLFFSIALWYGIENKAIGKVDIFDISMGVKSENIRMYLFSKLKKRFNFVKDVKIILQYPVIYAEDAFITYIPHSEIWDQVTDKKVVTINDTFFDNRFSQFEKVFKSFGLDYLFCFEISNNKCMVGISSNRPISQHELEQINMIVSSFSIDLQSLSVINSVKFMKVLSFEFELLKQSQMNLLKSNKNLVIDTPKGQINVISYWEPMIDLAGDIYGVNNLGTYLTSWISDICGKGLSAAAISFTCYTLINQVIKNNISIKKSAEMINEILVNEPLFSVENFFLTLSGMTINTETLEAEVVNCGNPPIIFFDGKEVKEINPRGGIIGIFDKVDIETFNVQLEKGMLFLMFSDGITDVYLQKGNVDQFENLKNIVSTYSTPELIWEHIMENILKLSLYKNIEDDITLTMIYLK